MLNPIIYLLRRISEALLNFADRNVDRAARKQGWTAEQTEAFRRIRRTIKDVRAELDAPCKSCGKRH